jgi:hypothetical protein
MNLILPESMDAPSIPDYFMRGLREIDPCLVVYWNNFRKRFILDRCINPDPHTHNPSCERVNVTIVQDPEGGYMGPNDRTLDWIKAHDSWTIYGTLENQRRARENAKADFETKRVASAREGYKEAMLDDRVQINRALHLIQQHDVARPHK